MSIFSVSLRFILLAFKILLNIGSNLLFHLRERKVSLDKFDYFRDSGVSLYRIVMMLFNIVLFLSWLDGELSLYNRELFGIVL